MIHTHKHTHDPEHPLEGAPARFEHEHEHGHDDNLGHGEPGHVHMSDSEDALSFTPIANGEEEGTAPGA